jgi:hypothetical protein
MTTATPELEARPHKRGRLPGTGVPEKFRGRKGRSGPPLGNRNNLRHGLLAGQLPPDAKYIEQRINGLRRKVEDAVLAVKRQISLLDAASIQTAMKWERHGMLALRWLNNEAKNLSPMERLHFSREIAKASSERDRCLHMLKLDQDARDQVIEALYKRIEEKR